MTNAFLLRSQVRLLSRRKKKKRKRNNSRKGRSDLRIRMNQRSVNSTNKGNCNLLNLLEREEYQN